MRHYTTGARSATRSRPGQRRSWASAALRSASSASRCTGRCSGARATDGSAAAQMLRTLTLPPHPHPHDHNHNHNHNNNNNNNNNLRSACCCCWGCWGARSRSQVLQRRRYDVYGSAVSRKGRVSSKPWQGYCCKMHPVCLFDYTFYPSARVIAMPGSFLREGALVP